MKDGGKLVVQVPAELQRVVGDNAQALITEAGVIIRKYAPLQVSGWKAIDITEKEKLWLMLKEKFQLEDNALVRKAISTQFNRQYRNWRHRLHKQHFLPHANPQEALKDRHPDVPPESWAYLCQYFQSDEYQRKSNRNVENRKKQVISHSTGTKSYSRISREVIDSITGEAIGVIGLWKETHFNKGKGAWVDQHSKECYEEMVKRKDKAIEEGESIPEAQICEEVLGSVSGYVRGCGPGPKPAKSSSLQASETRLEEQRMRADKAEASNAIMNKIMEDMTKRQAEIEGWFQQVVEQMKNQRSSPTPSPTSDSLSTE